MAYVVVHVVIESQLPFITVTVFMKRLSPVRLSSSSVSFTSVGHVRHMPACFVLWTWLFLTSYCCVVVFYCWFRTVNMVGCWWWFRTVVWLLVMKCCICYWCRTVMWLYVVGFVVLCGWLVGCFRTVMWLFVADPSDRVV